MPATEEESCDEAMMEIELEERSRSGEEQNASEGSRGRELVEIVQMVQEFVMVVRLTMIVRVVRGRSSVSHCRTTNDVCQTTARYGNTMGILGVSSGLVATLTTQDFSSGRRHYPPLIYPTCSFAAVLKQASVIMGAGVAVGASIASKVGVTELPQLVAAFHSLVGVAAVATAIASMLLAPAHSAAVATTGALIHKASSYVAAVIGAITVTGRWRIPRARIMALPLLFLQHRRLWKASGPLVGQAFHPPRVRIPSRKVFSSPLRPAESA
eukprot:754255-Hanusia_phi.AAC.2